MNFYTVIVLMDFDWLMKNFEIHLMFLKNNRLDFFFIYLFNILPSRLINGGHSRSSASRIKYSSFSHLSFGDIERLFD